VKTDRETFEALRAECEALKHRQAAMESDIARVESLKEKVAALSWENDHLQEKNQMARTQLERYKGLAMAVQQGLLAWKKTPEANQFRATEAEKMRWLYVAGEMPDVGEDNRPVQYAGLTPVEVTNK
jgi:predicted  nucleic acid-binding Zn-ribbon protein